MELIKRLRRMADGVIYPYSDALAQSFGMEVVMCDGDNQVHEVIGEIGSLGVHGRRYVGATIPEHEAQERLRAPQKKASGKKRTSKKAGVNAPLGSGASGPTVTTGRGVLADVADNSDLSG